MATVQRATFVNTALDQGQECTDYIIAHLSYTTMCKHRVDPITLQTMKDIGMKRMICPQCGVKCTL